MIQHSFMSFRAIPPPASAEFRVPDSDDDDDDGESSVREPLFNQLPAERSLSGSTPLPSTKTPCDDDDDNVDNEISDDGHRTGQSDVSSLGSWISEVPAERCLHCIRVLRALMPFLDGPDRQSLALLTEFMYEQVVEAMTHESEAGHGKFATALASLLLSIQSPKPAGPS